MVVGLLVQQQTAVGILNSVFGWISIFYYNLTIRNNYSDFYLSQFNWPFSFGSSARRSISLFRISSRSTLSLFAYIKNGFRPWKGQPSCFMNSVGCIIGPKGILFFVLLKAVNALGKLCIIFGNTHVVSRQKCY